ncbi:hypothetical protein HPC62_03995 [Thermoleptolyngbya sichuanensis A183]|uniref:Uncharacterized protein n=1 Tax=Thermoleptolyngbya sichuanensis A183 TaxID=2737172 RepID=A0A6M8B5S4_9CYAN|nr:MULTISPECIES: hypothetical protein [Thermoleptolyngbya]QKD81452.1 hypothetical protein HPC62_03995 [Thermoleptolyngbya sichuanensis A183]
MTPPNDSGSNSITPSDRIDVEMNGSGASSSGNQSPLESSQATLQETTQETTQATTQAASQKPPQKLHQKLPQGAIADAARGKPKTTIIVSPAIVSPAIVSPTSAPPSSGKGRQGWLIASLLLTSVVAGLGGAALGWAIRHHSQNPHAGEPPALLDPFVNNEQSFPPIEGWVGDDPVRRYSPEAFSEEVLPEAPPHTAPIRERQFQESPPIQTRRQIPEEFADPSGLPPVDEPAWAAPDTVPVEPPPQVSQPPAPSRFSSEPAPPEPPPPVQAPPLSESIHKTKPSSDIPEPPRQTQSVEIPVLPAPSSPSSP